MAGLFCVKGNKICHYTVIIASALYMNFRVPVLIISLLVLGLASCKVGDDAVPVSSTLSTKLNVVNAVTDTLNYYLNGSRVNTTSSLYPFGNTGYLDVPYTDQNYQFKRLGNADVLFNLSLTLDTNKVSSLYIAGRSAENTFTSLDTLKADTLSRAKIRFVNASPGSGDLDVRVGGGDTVFIRVRAYKSTSIFLPIGPGIKHVQVFRAGTTTAIADTSRTLLAGRMYTLFAKGTLTGTGGSKFGTGLVVNK